MSDDHDARHPAKYAASGHLNGPVAGVKYAASLVGGVCVGDPQRAQSTSADRKVTFQNLLLLEGQDYTGAMSTMDVVNDLIELERLAELEGDADRRLALLGVHDHVAERAQGAKVSDATRVLNVSPPTIRAWIDAGLLEAVPGRSPAQVTLTSLAAAKRALDEVRAHSSDRHLLAEVLRVLRDRAALAGDDVTAGLEDLHAGRRTTLTAAKLEELVPSPKRARRSKSN